jgi:hypothetical protein
MRAGCIVRVLAPITLLNTAPVMACQIPVFRYALENWESDPYVLVVAHRGELAPSDKSLLADLQAKLRDHGTSLNLELSVVDLSATEADDALLKAVLGDEVEAIRSPRMVLVFPHFAASGRFEGNPVHRDGGPTPVFPGATEVPIGLTPVPPGTSTLPSERSAAAAILPRLAWSGDLTYEQIRQLTESPARQQIAERLLDGHSAVWVLLESGDKAQDDAAYVVLNEALRRMQHTLSLADPETIQADEFYQKDTKIDLRIEFSVVRIPHERGDETIFATTLLNSEPESAKAEGPVAVPIFGRGRSLFALVGENINATTLEEDCRFLVGDCSCQVKRQNPGTDLLFAVAWQESVKGTAYQEIELPVLSGAGAFEADGPTKDEPDEMTDPQVPDVLARSEPANTATDSEAKQPVVPPQPTETEVAMAPEVSTSDVRSSATITPESPEAVSSVLLTWVLGNVAIGLVAPITGTVWLRSNTPS